MGDDVIGKGVFFFVFGFWFLVSFLGFRVQGPGSGSGSGSDSGFRAMITCMC